MSKKTGYDRYLEYQFRYSGDFFRNLFQAILIADSDNIEKLRLGFPEEVDAMLTFRLEGIEPFVAKCSPDHPILKEISEGKKGW